MLTLLELVGGRADQDDGWCCACGVFGVSGNYPMILAILDVSVDKRYTESGHSSIHARILPSTGIVLAHFCNPN